MKTNLFLVGCLSLVAFVGCADQPNAEQTADVSTVSAEGAKYLLSDLPADALEVNQVREAVQDGDEVTMVGRIGGSVNPWNEGRAAFTLVDNSLKACSDIPGDKCKKPWDYCCVSGKKIAASSALIKVVDDQGDLVKADARKLLPVKELSTVVVKGKAQLDDAGNLTVLAHGVYVQKD